ncbi:MAG: hypothetical protein GX410_03160 [Elusimicrobia bacterium]|nr:hypothetical protein [Elusimicrobiota bacterium]
MRKLLLPVLLLSAVFCRAEEPCKNDYFGFAVKAPAGWRAEKLYWQGLKKPLGSEASLSQVNSGLPPKNTEWTGREIGCKFTGPEGAVYARATSAAAPDAPPFQECGGDLDLPAPAPALERLVSSEVFVSSYGISGIFARRGPSGMGGPPTPVYYFPLSEPRKLWDLNMLSVMLFAAPASGRDVSGPLREVSSSFSFYGGEASEFDEDDDGKLFNARIGAVYYLTLPSRKNCRWEVAQAPDGAVAVSLESQDARQTRWALTPLSPARTELVFNLYDARGKFRTRYTLRLKAAVK